MFQTSKFHRSPSYLIRNPYSYCFRIIVPEDLRDIVARREIRLSLRTGRLSEAKQMAGLMGRLFKQLFTQIRNNRVAYGRADIEARVRTIIGFVMADSSDLPRSNPGPEVFTQEPSILLDDLFQEFKAKKVESGRWGENTVRNHQPKFNAFSQFIGNRPVNFITKPMVIEFTKLLDRLPPRFVDHDEYKDLSRVKPDDLIGKHEKTLDVSTKVTYLNFIRSMFTHAVNHEYVDRNPVDGLVPDKKKGARQQRDPFSIDDLKKIFDPNHYPLQEEKASRFWLPVMALYTGCRLEELSQLYTEDVNEVDGIWVLDINNSKDKKVKTEASKRLVPLHPYLVYVLKFPEFVKKVKEREHDRVFWELTKYNNKYGHKVTEWFRRYKDGIGIKAPRGKKVFHSFRHNVTDHLYKAMVMESLIEEFTGRAGKTETRKRYAKGYRVKTLYEEVAGLSRKRYESTK
jgi:integrase